MTNGSVDYYIVSGIRVSTIDAIQKAGSLTTVGPAFCLSRNHRRKWYRVCECVCGTICVIEVYSMYSGNTTSCGCLRKVRAREACTTHNGHGTLTYSSWAAMVARCTNPIYAEYHGRGIRIHPDLRSFEGFVAHMGQRPSAAHSLDRIDVNGDYRPGNVRWATKTVQALNRRNSRRITAFGRTQSLSEWVAEAGIAKSTVHDRLSRGWEPEKALCTQPQTREINKDAKK